MRKSLFFFLISLLLISCTTEADLIIHNAVVYTVNDNFDMATTVVVKDGKFIAVGGEDLLDQYTATDIVNLKGYPIYPGFIDGHCHFYNFGLLQGQLDLRDTNSFDEILQKVKEYSEKFPNIPILGQGWDQNKWENIEYPTKHKLDELFPNQLIALKRVDGHALLVNQAMLDLAKIDNNTKIEGGTYVKENNTLTGVLVDNAMDRVYKALPSPNIEQQIKALLAAQKICVKNGLTTVDDAGLNMKQIQLIDSLQKNGILDIRVYGMISNNKENLEYYLPQGPIQTERLNIRSIKVYADGALGSRGAALKKEYADDPGNKGFYLTPIQEIENLAYILAEKGFQMNTHAIGDAANHEVLKIYKKALANITDPRWRIEHAQVVDSLDRELFEDKIIPSIQPTHATSDMFWADERLGDRRIENAYAYKSLLDWSGKIVLGTDFPVENVSPLKTFYAAVARTNEEQLPKGGFQMKEALTRLEALKGMTIWAAYANFEENIKGSIEVGKVADMVVLQQDIMKIDIHKVPKVEVITTIINGNLVYMKPNN